MSNPSTSTDFSGAAALAKVSEERAFKMQFMLVGFSQDGGFRVFTFEGIGEDRTRTKFTVRTDLALIRGYGIRMQELPLLCREYLERATLVEVGSTEPERTWTYTEDEMRLHASGCAAVRDAAQRKKSMRRIAPNPNGTASRAQHPW